MDEYLGGKVAAEYFLMSSADDNKNLEGMFVLSELANIGLQERLLGLTENAGNLPVTTVVVDGSDAADMESVLTEAIAGCSYTHILLGTAEPVAALIQAMKTAGCSFDDVVIGTFDVNEEIFKAITDGQLDFTISQQTHLQASLPVVMASLFATTGRKLSASSESRSGVYLSGPMLINATNLPSLEDQVCRSESFPICPNTLNPVGETASCPCIDRSQIKLRGITHGITTDTFWDTVYEAFGHAAADFGVDVEVIRPEPSDDLYDVMAAAIQDFCSQGIDGLIVSIPSSIVAEALSTCLDNSISVISLNAGSSEAKELGLMNHLGQIEFNAGKRAGEQMIELGVTTGACLRHVVNNTALMDRCNGMKEAFDESEEKVTYFGDMDVSPDAVDTYIADVEAFIGDTGSWDGWGILFGGDAQVVPALSLKEQHSDLVLAAFDTSEAVYKALDSGEIAFAVCQNEYLQGYFPIPLLAWKVYAQQFLISTYVETGPRLYFESPSDAEAQCEANGYEVCSSGAIMQSIGVFGLLLAGMTFVLFGL
jgi:simple sugar transport system substrate-binding protein